MVITLWVSKNKCSPRWSKNYPRAERSQCSPMFDFGFQHRTLWTGQQILKSRCKQLLDVLPTLRMEMATTLLSIKEQLHPSVLAGQRILLVWHFPSVAPHV
ncbi:hypothetical protein BaRGS_00000270 [Batillaria attramentaria]|uniref:Uncharacterized protein n=1 Tax=Batillaria attramentaria TaxID=370345 RepID=A0ABD0MC57_9CAEN